MLPSFGDVSPIYVLLPCREVSYELIFGCDANETIEFAVQTNLRRWIPLMTYGAKEDTAVIRGYTVQTTSTSLESRIMEHVHICGDLLRDASGIRFRWMGTPNLEAGQRERNGIWALANASANLIMENQTFRLFTDSFSSDDLK